MTAIITVDGKFLRNRNGDTSEEYADAMQFGYATDAALVAIALHKKNSKIKVIEAYGCDNEKVVFTTEPLV